MRLSFSFSVAMWKSCRSSYGRLAIASRWVRSPGPMLPQQSLSLAGGRSQLLTAQANYTASVGTYRQVIGVAPGQLAPASPVDRFSPPTLAKAVALGVQASPAVAVAAFNIDAAELNVKVAEGALLPNLSVQASVQQNWLGVGQLSTMDSFNASVLGTLNVPIYQGESEYSLIRQAKKRLSDSANSTSPRPVIKLDRVSYKHGDSWTPPEQTSKLPRLKCRPQKSH